MKSKHLSKWLVLVAISAIFIACKKDEIKEEVSINPNAIGGGATTFILDTLTIKLSTLLDKEFIASRSDVLLAGGYQEDELGSWNARSFFQVIPSSNTVNFGTNPICDSLILELHIAKNEDIAVAYGDFSQPYQLEVYKLLQPFSTTKRYTVNDEISMESQPLGSTDANYVFSPVDSIVRISLSKEYGQYIINNGITSRTQFLGSYPGFCLSHAGTPSAVAGFTVNNDKSKVTIYYNNEEEGTKTFLCPVRQNSIRFNQIVADRTGSTLSSLSSDGNMVTTDLTNGTAYTQSGSGIITKIEIPHLQSTLIELGRVAIHKAELSLFVDQTKFVNANRTNNFQLYTIVNNRVKRDADNVAFIIRNFENVLSGGTIPYYSRSDIELKMNITAHMQELVYQPSEVNSFAISPEDNAKSATRIAFESGKNDQDLKPVLKLYITK